MDDRKVLAAIIVMGLAALITHALDLWHWYVEGRAIEPVVIDTQTNGGVRTTTAWSGTSHTR